MADVNATDTGAGAKRTATQAPLPRNVKILAAVSFLTDVASELVYPLLPLFLTTTLGVSAAGLGVIEGFAESVSSLLRLPAGWWSDRSGRRKPLVVVGYTIAALARPLIGLAQSAGQVLAIRMSDRFGKGIRTAPRDALIADSVPVEQRGYAYGVHRGSDNLGAVFGPLIAWAALTYQWADLRTLFYWTALPGLLSVIFLIIFVREGPRPLAAPRVVAAASVKQETDVDGLPVPALHHEPDQPLGSAFWRMLAVIFLFTLSLSTDAFLLLRASQLGVPQAMIPILWAALHVVKSSSSFVGGAMSDRFGRRPLILAGWGIYGFVYLGFAVASAEWHAWALFVVYGLYFGFSEGTEKALVADLAPPARRGAAFGWFNAAVGIAALPASILFGVVWDAYGAEVAFTMAAGIAALSSVLFAVLVPAARNGNGQSNAGA
ncbi:MAG: MFS transporter [Gemmatimonas sp.]|nr:MFS transporter [Gemmatimonas sp.]